MANRLNLDTDNPSLKDLLKEADKWASLDAKDLTVDQVAILNLKRIIELKDQAGVQGGGKECFICATGA